MRSGFLGLGVLQLLLILQFDTTYCDSPLSVDYVYTSRAECHFMNGTQRVRLLYRIFYNEEEQLYFDSDVGYFIPKTEYGRPDAEYWNKDKEFIEQQKAEVQTYCIPNYELSENAGITGRRVKPTAKVSLMPHYEDSNTDLQLLVCNVYGYYPSKTEVKWYRNGQEETAQVQSTEPFQNGDWTFQVLVMLETDVKKGDVFTCEVHHISLETPMRIDWRPQISDSAKSKMATGIVGFVLGAVFIIAGVLLYMRGRKVQTTFRGPQAEQFIHT
ncbi:H-2 class II histocompatibility antigen, E-S beta chain-like [Aquarana catesbeiana]|uniref:H-2 class II histocompatibility antigen, E-S beta chain-like n=1 Tax=Aquarana catesbeiana TaxID=8400 RepID=UPI003CCA4876